MPALIIIFLLLYFGANTWIFVALWQEMSSFPLIAKIIVAVCHCFLAFGFPILHLLRHKMLSPTLMHALYISSSTWLVYILYMTLALILFALLRLFGLHILHGFWYCFAATALLLIAGNINYNQLKIRKIEISTEKQIGQSAPFRIVAVSDLHLGYGIGKTRLSKFVDAINEQNPDLIIIGGDLIDMSMTPVWQEKMHEELNRLRAAHGIVMVPGNHEYISNISEVERFLKETDIVLLRDSVMTLSNGMQIVGHDDKSNRQRRSVPILLSAATPEKFTIFVDHQPENDVVEQVSRSVDFAFFGHTHNGQFFPINLITRAMYRYSYGEKELNRAKIYTSSGLGLWGAPVRIGSKSEIVVVEVK